MFVLYLLIGTAAALAIWLLLKSLANANPANVVKGAKIGGAVIGGVAGLWLLLTGRLWSALAMASMFAPQLGRWFTAWKIGRNAGAPDPDATSDVTSAYLRMELDHATGALDGLVLDGRWRGRRLSELDAEALLDLLNRASSNVRESPANLLPNGLLLTVNELIQIDKHASIDGHLCLLVVSCNYISYASQGWDGNCHIWMHQKLH